MGSWEEGPALHGNDLNPIGAFNSDGRLLALGDASGVARLVDPETGKELAHLTAPEDGRLAPIGFTADGARLITLNDAGGLLLFDLRRSVRGWWS